MAEAIGRELDWDDEIENESGGWVLLPEGDYDFVVENFERGRHGGSAKLPPCNKAILTLGMDSPEGEHASVTCNLFLFSTQEWKLCQFFTCIGARKKGEKTRPNWNLVMGARGRCKVTIRNYTGNDGKEHQTNEIDRFYPPEEGGSGQPQQPKWKAGAF